MTNEKEIYKKAWHLWGEKLQLTMVIEECSELQHLCCKAIRGKNDKCFIEKLAEEIADTQIMINQLKFMFTGDIIVEKKMLKKIKRLEQKISRATK